MTSTTTCGGPTTSGSTPPPDTGARRNSPNKDSSSKKLSNTLLPIQSRKDNCLDNGATEQVFGHLKDEFFRKRSWPDFDSFKRNLDGYVVHWNTRRRQVALNGLAPEEFRNRSLTE